MPRFEQRLINVFVVKISVAKPLKFQPKFIFGCFQRLKAVKRAG